MNRKPHKSAIKQRYEGLPLSFPDGGNCAAANSFRFHAAPKRVTLALAMLRAWNADPTVL